MGRFTQSYAGRDQRQDKRRDFRMPAWIDRGPKLPPVACTFEDVSEGGARVRLERDDPLPARFILLLSKSAIVGILCEVRWRSGETVGVKYLGKGAPTERVVPF